ncbi:MAG TPA: LpxD N-terminal domain-containing protein, partial [Devosia sp.]
MVDTRFHKSSEALALTALLAGLPRHVSIDDPRAEDFSVLGVDELVYAGPGHIALAAHKNYLDDLKTTSAGLVVVLPALREAVPPSSIALVDDDPHELFADILDAFYPASTRGGVGGMAVGTAPLLEDDVVLGPNVVLGDGVE